MPDRQLPLGERLLGDPRFTFDPNRATIAYRSEEGMRWEASRYGYNGGSKGEPKRHYVDTSIHYPGFGGCDHEIELTRDDLLALLAMVEQANEWSKDD
jgi:hypothetical protein